MRRVLVGDLLAFAGWLRDLPQETWRSEASTALDRIHAADKFRKRFGVIHPEWGDGSMIAYVLSNQAAPSLVNVSTEGNMAALQATIEQLRAWRGRVREDHARK